MLLAVVIVVPTLVASDWLLATSMPPLAVSRPVKVEVVATASVPVKLALLDIV